MRAVISPLSFMRNFLTSQRIKTFLDNINKLNKQRKYDYPLNGLDILKNITSWNQFQHLNKSVSNLSKIDNFKTSEYARNQVEKVVNAFNKKSASIEFVGKLNAESLLENATSWKDLQQTLKLYKNFLKKGAEKIVRENNGIPITQWEADIENNLLPIINERRKDQKTRTNYSFESGNWINAHNNGFNPRTSPSRIAKNKADYSTGIQSLINESQSSFWKNRYNVYKDNYILLINRLEDTELRNNMLSIIIPLSAETIFKAGTEDFLLSIDFFYDDSTGEENYYRTSSVIYNAWKQYL